MVEATIEILAEEMRFRRGQVDGRIVLKLVVDPGRRALDGADDDEMRQAVVGHCLFPFVSDPVLRGRSQGSWRAAACPPRPAYGRPGKRCCGDRKSGGEGKDG